MIRDLPALDDLLAGTPLQGRPRKALRVPGSSDVAFALALDPRSADPCESWEICRQRLDASGRWPVVVTAWGGGFESWRGEEFFGRFPFEEEPGATSPEDGRPAAVVARSETADVDGALAGRAARALAWQSFSAALDAALDEIESRIGSCPDPEVVMDLQRSGKLPDYGTFQRWLLAWEADHARGDETAVYGDRYLDWFMDGNHDPLALLLLPTPRGPEALAYLHFFGCEGIGSAAGIALLNRWHERWGAELVGHHGTMLELVVGRPPATLPEALDLAWEQENFAECTTIPAGIPTIHHARMLVGRQRWFLHERP